MNKELFAEVILPLAVKGTFTYRVPAELAELIFPGSRVLVGFGKRKIYSGIVSRLHDNGDNEGVIKDILKVSDSEPVAGEKHLRFWKWLADYYICSEGEVMRAALPSALLIEGLTTGSGITVNEKYKPREETFMVLSRKYPETELGNILDNLTKAPKQQDLLLAYLRITDYRNGSDIFPVRKADLIKESGSSPAAAAAMEKKGIFISLNLEVSRIKKENREVIPLQDLTATQSEALSKIRTLMEEKGIVLLHGVTSSGKTELYIHLIDEQLKKGRQVLYLLPEIALTTQLIERLRKHFGDSTGLYHSRLNDAEQAEVWKRAASADPSERLSLIVGARSALFLPLIDPGLIIVDEEHDSSYKQNDPSPRYNARDSAIMLASMNRIPVILGSATPSLESYTNAVAGKYGLVELSERYGNVRMPEIILADTRDAARRKLMVSHFSPQLLHAVDNALGKNEQVILFRNRRGFSSYLQCSECGWIPSCNNCSVNLTYHKDKNRLVCHYCGSSETIPPKCGSCGNLSLSTIGFGTEKLEDEIKIVFPDARVARIDQDSTRSKSAFRRILTAFEAGQTDILIGTQMISKGLDFKNVTAVGILNASGLLNFPDFRAHERAFQLLSQVSGRAGRREKPGRVVIQTSDPDHRIIRQVLNNDYCGMYKTQIEERKMFNYPPFCRIIKIVLKHRDRSSLNEFSSALGDDLKKDFGNRVLGPEYPLISRIQSWYIKNIIVKIEKEKPLSKARKMIRESAERIEKLPGAGSLRIVIDVDPYQ